MPSRRTLTLLAAAVAAVLLLTACGGDGGTAAAASNSKPVTVRLGYFANITHAPAIVGIEGGLFQDALGADGLKTFAFNAGPEASEALLSGAIDATFIGPNPSINAYAKSKAVRIIAGATSGGASFVTRSGITKDSDLKGKTFSTPQLGNTQDVALRYYLERHGLSADTSGGGDVHIRPQQNSSTLDQFKAGQIDGAWVPEPWATRLVVEGGGHVFVDEATQWPGGRFVTTNLLVRADFLAKHPAAVERLLRGELDAIRLITSKPAKAKQLVGAGIVKITGKNITAEETDRAWSRMTFTADPIAASLRGSAKHAADVELLPADTSIKGIYDLRLLNKVLTARGGSKVRS
ncbi:MAG: ABC transporter substrate-binding protein [Acidobacteria bacterium]|nr:ABC transporter substrate-binding protein [Acidobacteriota bacterium]